MNLYLWPVVIFLTAVTVLLGVGWWMTRGDQKIPLARLADPEPLPGKRPRHNPPHDPEFCLRCRYWARVDGAAYGPFPADTGPLLLLSEAAAAVEAHEREVQAMIRQAQRLGMMP